MRIIQWTALPSPCARRAYAGSPGPVAPRASRMACSHGAGHSDTVCTRLLGSAAIPTQCALGY
eukprot:309404-Hanusia_phi.AAC.1